MEPTRRYVDADNSCLYSSIGYLLDHNNFNNLTKYQYRQLLANFLINKNIEDSLVISKDEFIDNIVDINTWGGGLEIKYFGEMFQLQIAVINIQANNVMIFGEDKNYLQRIYLIYNGIHYDPLVMAMSDNSKDDITIFSSDDYETIISFQNFAKTFHDRGDFVNLSKMNSLQCNICNVQFNTQDDAQNHAINYNHWNFSAI